MTFDKETLDLGEFGWQEEQTDTFVLTNEGHYPFVIEGVRVSCGCLKVEYNKKPVPCKQKSLVAVRYKADRPGDVYKKFRLYGNMNEDGYLDLILKGKAK